MTIKSFKKGSWEYTHYVISGNKKIYLSVRQAQCLLLLKDNTEKAIASQLGLSPGTVNSYLRAVKEKCNCFSRKDLVKIAAATKAIVC